MNAQPLSPAELEYLRALAEAHPDDAWAKQDLRLIATIDQLQTRLEALRALIANFSHLME